MSDMRPTGAPLRFAKKDYHLLFTVNVIDQIVERFDVDINELSTLILQGKNRKYYANTAAILTFLLNDDIALQNEERSPEEQQEPLTEAYVRRHISNLNYPSVLAAITSAYVCSFMEKDEDDMGENVPNRESGSA